MKEILVESSVGRRYLDHTEQTITVTTTAILLKTDTTATRTSSWQQNNSLDEMTSTEPGSLQIRDFTTAVTLTHSHLRHHDEIGRY